MAKMKISLEKLMKALSLKHISGELEREASSVYVGDMLSWVMSHALPDVYHTDDIIRGLRSDSTY